MSIYMYIKLLSKSTPDYRRLVQYRRAKLRKNPIWVNVSEVVLRHLPDATLESIPPQLVRFPFLGGERGRKCSFRRISHRVIILWKKFSNKNCSSKNSTWKMFYKNFCRVDRKAARGRDSEKCRLLPFSDVCSLVWSLDYNNRYVKVINAIGNLSLILLLEVFFAKNSSRRDINDELARKHAIMCCAD